MFRWVPGQALDRALGKVGLELLDKVGLEEAAGEGGEGGSPVEGLQGRGLLLSRGLPCGGARRGFHLQGFELTSQRGTERALGFRIPVLASALLPVCL